MVVQPKIKILERGKLSRTNEIIPLKIETRAKQGQNSFALHTRSLSTNLIDWSSFVRRFSSV